MVRFTGGLFYSLKYLVHFCFLLIVVLYAVVIFFPILRHFVDKFSISEVPFSVTIIKFSVFKRIILVMVVVGWTGSG